MHSWNFVGVDTQLEGFKGITILHNTQSVGINITYFYTCNVILFVLVVFAQ